MYLAHRLLVALSRFLTLRPLSSCALQLDPQGNLFNIYMDGNKRRITPVGNISEMKKFKVNWGVDMHCNCLDSNSLIAFWLISPGGVSPAAVYEEHATCRHMLLVHVLLLW